jgi:GT2 family glycosyltransferase
LADISVSIVIYHSDVETLAQTIASLDRAVENLRGKRPSDAKVVVSLIDNGAPRRADGPVWGAADNEGRYERLDIRRCEGQGNVGYGAGHNLAIDIAAAHYHLILNPDVVIAREALERALDFLDEQPDVIALSPRIEGGEGELQYLCRRYPSIADLFIRGFLPRACRQYFASRLARYEMKMEIDGLEFSEKKHDSLPEEVLFPEIISGCFMLFRQSGLKRLGGFDCRYFLYFEDYDLSLRAGTIGRLAYVPSVRIVHYGGGAARKGYRHIALFIQSAAKFFSRFGWRLL